MYAISNGIITNSKGSFSIGGTINESEYSISIGGKSISGYYNNNSDEGSSSGLDNKKEEDTATNCHYNISSGGGKATGRGSLAISSNENGYKTAATNTGSIAIGLGNMSKAFHSTAVGVKCNIGVHKTFSNPNNEIVNKDCFLGAGSAAIGRYLTVIGDDNSVFGTKNLVLGAQNLVSGYHNLITSSDLTQVGNTTLPSYTECNSNLIYGTYNRIEKANNSICGGTFNSINCNSKGYNNIVLGGPLTISNIYLARIGTTNEYYIYMKYKDENNIEVFEKITIRTFIGDLISNSNTYDVNGNLKYIASMIFPDYNTTIPNTNIKHIYPGIETLIVENDGTIKITPELDLMENYVLHDTIVIAGQSV